MTAEAQAEFLPIIAKCEAVIEVILSYILKKHSLVGTASGGKDSTCTTLLMIEALRRAKAMGADIAPCYITSADTTIENPSMAKHLEGFLVELQEFCTAEELPVTVKVATPSLASQFVVTTIGRGSLPRTVENSVKDGEKKRPCSDDWKVKPQQALTRVLIDEVVQSGYGEPITIIGTRYDESTSRGSSMASRGEDDQVTSRDKAGRLTLSPIAYWTGGDEYDMGDIWYFVAMITNGAYPYALPVPVRTIERMHQLYKDANGGVCGVTLGNGGNKAACGSRFGCSLCLISGDKDKSMEAMINDESGAHAHLAGINKFRNYLMATQWDLSKRELVGRTLSPAGYLSVKPDVLSFAERMRLLRMLLTLDAIEIDRAEQHEADYVTGRIPQTEANRELCDVQFTMISPRQLVAIDFQLSMHHYAPHAWPAICAWYDVHVLGRRYPVPEVDKTPKVQVHRHGWYYVGKFNAEVPTDGLRDYQAELWNKYRHPDRTFHYGQTSNGDQICYFEESDQLDVDAERACTFVTCTFDMKMYQQAQMFPAIDSARFWLNETILTVPTGMAQTYQDMAVRGQYFAHLADKLNITPAEMDRHLIKHAISDTEHDAICAAKAHELQMPLFA